jgi:MATE family multidrug resistance protein
MKPKTLRPSLGKDLTELLTLAWPVVISRVGFMTMGLIDTLVVARYSTEQLGFHALAWAMSGVVLTTGLGLLSGVQVMTARHRGEGRPEATGGVLRRGAVYAFWIGMVSMLTLGLGSQMLLRSLRLDPVLVAGAAPVLTVFALSLPFHMVGAAGSYYLEALSRPRTVTVAVLSCNLLNLAADLVLVPGGFGIPPLGAAGAAWGTFLARLVLLIWFYLAIFAQKDARALGLFAKPIDGKAAAAEQRRIGYGAGISMFVESAAFTAMSIIAGWLGGLAVAGWGILLNTAALIFMAPMGLGAAASVLVGKAYGAGDRIGVRRFGALSFGVCIGVLTLVALVVFAAADPIAAGFTPDPVLGRMVAGGLVLSCLFFVADGLQVVAANALRAQSDVVIPTVTHTLSYTFVMCPLAWALAIPFGLGLSGIVWAVAVASLLAAGLLLGRFWWITRPLRA